MKQNPWRTTLPLFLAFISLLIVIHGSSAARAAAAWGDKIDGRVLAATSDGRSAEFVVVLSEQADVSGAAMMRDKTARGRFVYETKTALAVRTQAPLRALLDARGATYRPYWIRNMIWVRGDRDLVIDLAARTGVEYIHANEWRRVQLPSPAATVPDSRAAELIEWNIELVNAPDVWALGFDGQGVVIGGQDTGYEWDHPVIMDQYRGWDGANADHAYNWHDAIHEESPVNSSPNPCGLNLSAPCDDNGHGTHTMGTMVGRTAQTTYGMAPGARWIGCRNMESGEGTPLTYAECFEWFIAPYPPGGDSFTDGDPSKAPHVINNSWSCPAAEGCTAYDALLDVVEAVRAAGIVTVQSAGNNGSGCSSIYTPPAVYDASFTVGATDLYDHIASFSSRGPVLVDGSNRRSPDIVAPGVQVLSGYRNGGYAELSGTSMAAPHVAGMVALLISAEPSLAGQVNELERIVIESAVPLTTTQLCGDDDETSVPNNVYGWGRIDALAAVEALTPVERPFSSLLPAVLKR